MLLHPNDYGEKAQIQHPESCTLGINKKPQTKQAKPAQASRNLVLMELLQAWDVTKDLIPSSCWLVKCMSEILWHLVKRTADDPYLDTWIIFLSYENGFWSQWVYMVNFYFCCCLCKILKEAGGFPFTLIFKCTLHFCVNTTSCSYDLDRPIDVYYMYLRMQTSSNISYLQTECRHLRLLLIAGGKEGRSWGSLIFSSFAVYSSSTPLNTMAWKALQIISLKQVLS